MASLAAFTAVLAAQASKGTVRASLTASYAVRLEISLVRIHLAPPGSPCVLDFLRQPPPSPLSSLSIANSWIAAMPREYRSGVGAPPINAVRTPSPA